VETCDASDSGRTRLEGTLHNTLLRACAVKELFSACRDDWYQSSMCASLFLSWTLGWCSAPWNTTCWMYTHSVYLTLGWLSTVSDNNNVTVSSSQAVFFFIYAQVNMSYTRVTNPAKWRHGAHTVAKPNLLEKWRGKYETVSFPCATTT